MKSKAYTPLTYVLIICSMTGALNACLYYQTDKESVLETVHTTILHAEDALKNADVDEERLEELIYLLRIFIVTEPRIADQQIDALDEQYEEQYAASCQPVHNEPQNETFSDDDLTGDEKHNFTYENSEEGAPQAYDTTEKSDEDYDEDENLPSDTSEVAEDLDEVHEASTDLESTESRSGDDIKYFSRSYIRTIDSHYDSLIRSNSKYVRYEDFSFFRFSVRKVCRALYLKKIEVMLLRRPHDACAEASLYFRALSQLDDINTETSHISAETRKADALIGRLPGTTNQTATLERFFVIPAALVNDTPQAVQYWQEQFISCWRIVRWGAHYNRLLQHCELLPYHHTALHVAKKKMAPALYNIAKTYYIMVHLRPSFANRLIHDLKKELSAPDGNLLFPIIRVQVDRTSILDSVKWDFSQALKYLELCLINDALPLEKRAEVALYIDALLNDALLNCNRESEPILYLKAVSSLKAFSCRTELPGDLRIWCGLCGLKTIENDVDIPEKINKLLALREIEDAPSEFKRAAVLLAIRLAYEHAVDFITTDAHRLGLVCEEYARRYEPLDTPFLTVPTPDDNSSNDLILTLMLIKHHASHSTQMPASFRCEKELKRLLCLATDRSVRSMLHTHLGDYMVTCNGEASNETAYLNYRAALAIIPWEDSENASSCAAAMSDIIDKIVGLLTKMHGNSGKADTFLHDMISFFDAPCTEDHYWFHHNGCPKDAIEKALFHALQSNHKLDHFDAIKRLHVDKGVRRSEEDGRVLLALGITPYSSNTKKRKR